MHDVVEGLEFFLDSQFIVFPSYQANIDSFVSRPPTIWEGSHGSLVIVNTGQGVGVKRNRDLHCSYLRRKLQDLGSGSRLETYHELNCPCLLLPRGRKRVVVTFRFEVVADLNPMYGMLSMMIGDEKRQDLTKPCAICNRTGAICSNKEDPEGSYKSLENLNSRPSLVLNRLPMVSTGVGHWPICNQLYMNPGTSLIGQVLFQVLRQVCEKTCSVTRIQKSYSYFEKNGH